MQNVTPPLITLPFKLERPEPPFGENEIRYPEGLVRYFLKAYTKKNSRIFDPFVGLGTTLFTAEEMGRDPYGIEYDALRFAWVAGQLEHWNQIIQGDAKKVASFGFPKMDFCMTSPPYMPNWHKFNPLCAGNSKKAGYDTYLHQIKRIFSDIKPIMKNNAYIVMQADNLVHPKGQSYGYTPLVADLANTVGKIFKLENEIIVKWDKPKGAYQHTHCLVFRNK